MEGPGQNFCSVGNYRGVRFVLWSLAILVIRKLEAKRVRLKTNSRLLADRANQIIIEIIEYDDAMVELVPGKPRVKITGEMFQKAIEEKGEPSEKEAEMQQHFVRFLKSLARFNYFLNTGAIRSKELCADFGFSVDLMTGEARKMVLKNSDIDIASFAKAVADYLDRWKHREAKQFIATIRKTCK